MVEETVPSSSAISASAPVEVNGNAPLPSSASPSNFSTIATGVKLANGEILQADLVVVATGAWTPALFAQEGMGGLDQDQVLATGQSVATIQLTEEEAEEYRDVPVVSGDMVDIRSSMEEQESNVANPIWQWRYVDNRSDDWFLRLSPKSRKLDEK